MYNIGDSRYGENIIFQVGSPWMKKSVSTDFIKSGEGGLVSWVLRGLLGIEPSSMCFSNRA
jgi:hypothetical protein